MSEVICGFQFVRKTMLILAYLRPIADEQQNIQRHECESVISRQSLHILINQQFPYPYIDLGITGTPCQGELTQIN